MTKYLLYKVCILFFLSACGSQDQELGSADSLTMDIVQTSNQPKNNKKSDNFTAIGMASYYADRLHGRPTASGEPYDTAAFTAAHRTLPFGTMLKVTNIRTGKSVKVRVNDRGPFNQKRIIDLSKAAAKSLGFYRKGVARVGIEVKP